MNEHWYLGGIDMGEKPWFAQTRTRKELWIDRITILGGGLGIPLVIIIWFLQ